VTDISRLNISHANAIVNAANDALEDEIENYLYSDSSQNNIDSFEIKASPNSPVATINAIPASSEVDHID